MCGCSLPHSCVGRCHRIYTPLAKRFGSPQKQKSSAPPSLTLFPFMCSAEKGKTPSAVSHTHSHKHVQTHTHTQAQMFIHTHTTDSVSNKCRWWWRVGEHLIQYISVVRKIGCMWSIVVHHRQKKQHPNKKKKILLAYPPFFNLSGY